MEKVQRRTFEKLSLVTTGIGDFSDILFDLQVEGSSHLDPGKNPPIIFSIT